MVISTKRIAPVASVLPSRAMASFPLLRFWAMIPEPITHAKRKKEPTPSANRRRANVGVSGRMLWQTTFVVTEAVRQRAERGAIAVGCRFAVGEEGFPHDAVRIGDPALFRLGVAASRLPFFEHRTVGGLEAAIDLRQLLGALG